MLLLYMRSFRQSYNICAENQKYIFIDNKKKKKI